MKSVYDKKKPFDTMLADVGLNFILNIFKPATSVLNWELVRPMFCEKEEVKIGL